MRAVHVSHRKGIEVCAVGEGELSEEIHNLKLHPAKKFLSHLTRFKDTFSCPCCHNRAWGIHVMTVDPSLVDNRDDGDADLDLVTPRFVSGASIPGVKMPPPVVALPATCQACGYIALFDANLVDKEPADGK